MFQWNMNFRTSEPRKMMFDLTQWMDTFNSPVWNMKLQLAQDVDFTDRWFKPKKWSTQMWTWSSTIYWMWVAKSNSWDVIYRISWGNVQYWTWSTWTTLVSWINQSYASIVSFEWPKIWGLPLFSWTATWWNNRTLITSWLTESAYVSKYLFITWWAWYWQQKLITSNTTTEIFIEWVFDINPDATSTFTILDREWHIYISNWVDQVYRFNASLQYNIMSLLFTKKFHYMAVAYNRVFACRDDEDMLYFSDLWTFNFWKDNFIPLDPDWDKIAWIIANQDKIIIYKQYSRFRLIWSTPEFFELIKSDSHKWAIAPRSICSWNNAQFFLSENWIEMFSTLENSTLDEWLSISSVIMPTIQNISDSDRKNAVWVVVDNKMIMSISTKSYVYDMEQSAKKQMPIWSVYDTSFNIWVLLQWQMYYCTSGNTYQFNKNEITSTTNKNIIINSWRYDFKDMVRQKNIFRMRLNFVKANATTNINVKVKYDWWSEIDIITQDISVNPEINVVLNKLCYDIQVNMYSTTNKQFEFNMGEFVYDYLFRV
jgi:hypothetical protein